MKIKRVSIIALFVSLTVIGAAIKIPAVITSISLDIFPALIAGVLIDRKAGAIVAGFGHFVSAFFGGLPLGIFHLLIGVEMALIVWLFAMIYQSKPVLASLLFVFLNGVLASLPFIFILSFEFYLTLIPSLTLASALNVLLALIILPRLKSILLDNEVQIR